MTRTWLAGAILWATGCGGSFQEQDVAGLHASIGFECAHATLACDSCHVGVDAPTALEPACLGCHEPDRPASHDPTATASCEECHSECGWDAAASPHPPNYATPELHGVEFNLQSSAAGDCRDCHGAELTGDTAQSCDTCHANEGHADWRDDCTFCHGGTLDQTGAPPHDLDGATTEGLSFPPHAAHVQPGGDYRALGCEECHVDPTSALDPGHALDDTPGVSEVDFSGGIAIRTVWDGQSCSSDSCHGMGRPGNVMHPNDPPVQCGDCHGVTANDAPGSSVHDIHLDVTGVVCRDCHATVSGDGLAIVQPELHPNGVSDVAFPDPSIQLVDNGCLGTCHGVTHDGENFGHPEGYEEPEWHGTESLLGISTCTSCHGDDLQGGSSGQDCEECHEAGWRSDCTYCHGTTGDGAPPQDLDNNADEETISFKSHSEHASTQRHPAYGCEVCHGNASANYTDAVTDAGHWWDGDVGTAEVPFGGIAAGGTYSNGTCTNNYCHGSGRTGGTQADGPDSTSLGCDDCHASPPSAGAGGTGQHRDHNHNRVTCDWCHDSVANNSTTIGRSDLHVDGSVQVVFSSDANQWGGMSWDAANKRCSGRCHAGGDDENHGGDRWR